MSHGGVAVHASDGIGVRGAACHDAVDKVTMAAEAGILKNGRIGGFNHDGFVEVLKGEPFGVMVSIHALGNQLGDKGFR